MEENLGLHDEYLNPYNMDAIELAAWNAQHRGKHTVYGSGAEKQLAMSEQLRLELVQKKKLTQWR